jgi:DNA-directed RNA polymerase subunit RPC12/RpoP
MRSINKKTQPKTSKFEGILIGGGYIGHEKIEYVCSWCNRSLVRLSDRNNQSESWFCRNCSIEFNHDDEQVSHRQRLSIPSQDTEPCVTSIQYDYSKDVAIRHEPELRGGSAALAKKGTIRFTSYKERKG